MVYKDTKYRISPNLLLNQEKGCNYDFVGNKMLKNHVLHGKKQNNRYRKSQNTPYL